MTALRVNQAPSAPTRTPWVIAGLVILGIALDAAQQQTASILVLAIAVCGFILFILNAWSSPTAFLGFWVWLHLEDLVRLVTERFAVFFIKDALYATLFLGYCLHRRSRHGVAPKNPIAFPLLLYGLLVTFQCLNPAIENPLFPLVGFHAKLFYVPLLLISSVYFDSEQKVRQFLLFITLTLALECALAIVQYYRDPLWWYKLLDLNPKAEVIALRPFAGGDRLLRTGSVFNNPGRFGQFISVISVVVLGSMPLFKNSTKSLFLWILLVATIFVGGVLLQSTRATFYLFSIFWFITFIFHGRSRRAKGVALLFVPFLILGSNWILGKTEPNIKKYYLESITVDPVKANSIGDRIRRGMLQLHSSIDASGWIGHGTGTSSLGRQYVLERVEGGKENGYAALIWEFGILGPCLWIFMMGTLLAKGWRTYLELRNTQYGKLAFSIVVMIFSAFWVHYIGVQYMDNYLVSTHFWAIAGLLFALPGVVRRAEMESPPST